MLKDAVRDVRDRLGHIAHRPDGPVRPASVLLRRVHAAIDVDRACLWLEAQMVVESDVPMDLDSLVLRFAEVEVPAAFGNASSFDSDRPYALSVPLCIGVPFALLSQLPTKSYLHATIATTEGERQEVLCRMFFIEMEERDELEAVRYVDEEHGLVVHFFRGARRIAALAVERTRPFDASSLVPDPDAGVDLPSVLLRDAGMRVDTEHDCLCLDAELVVESDRSLDLGTMPFFLASQELEATLGGFEAAVSQRPFAYATTLRLRVPLSMLPILPTRSFLRVTLANLEGEPDETVVCRFVFASRHARYLLGATRYQDGVGNIEAYFYRGARRRAGLAVRRHQPFDGSVVAAANDEEALRTSIQAAFVAPRIDNDTEAERITLVSKMTVEADYPLTLGELYFRAGDYLIDAVTEADYPLDELRMSHAFRAKLTIPVEDAIQMDIHNQVCVCVDGPYGSETRASIRFIKAVPKYGALHGPYYKDEEHGLTIFFRQEGGWGTTFTVRHANHTDNNWSELKLTAAKVASKFAFWIDPVILYEKNAMHYEESARSVYERLIDEGEQNAWYVLRGDLIDELGIDEKYRAHILRQHSFKHYVYFFRSKRFVGTESIAHALELRSQNLLFQRKLTFPDNKYVFLQHGVMYMVSLDSPERRSFRRGGMRGESYIVVSSEKEAEHFIDLGGFDRETLLVCGLPKFDRSYLNPGADKIVIMPTWRPWEFAEMRVNPEETGYAQMIQRIVDAIPEELRDKLVVIPHPLFSADTFAQYAAKEQGEGEMVSYDELLRDCRLLITDYSSISYDAFYRGSSVLFYWEELDACMAEYGEPTHLMLNEDNAFGPVCWGPQDVTQRVRELYGSPREPEYERRYQELVEFHDGHNTDRLIEMIRERGVL